MHNSFDFSHISFLSGNEDVLVGCGETKVMKPFEPQVLSFLDKLSHTLMGSPEAAAYPDVISFAFWVRHASLNKLTEKLPKKEGGLRLGRGVAFHITPSNVPVMFAYSLAVGLLAGNVNIVRLPSRDFPQVRLIINAIEVNLEEYQELRRYICLIRYERSRETNNALSSICDLRILWGGDATVAELRKSPIPAKATDITFADRFSLAVLESDYYLETKNKHSIASGFYNDTYLSDQNACTSPKFIVWTGSKIQQAKNVFWKNLLPLLEEKYTLQPIQAVNKLSSAYKIMARWPEVRLASGSSNLIIRINTPKLYPEMVNYLDNSGFFFEYDCGNILELHDLCNHPKCQTLAYCGRKEILEPLLESRVKGIDRIIPLGRTMEFDVLWDGVNLLEWMTRHVTMPMSFS